MSICLVWTFLSSKFFPEENFWTYFSKIWTQTGPEPIKISAGLLCNPFFHANLRSFPQTLLKLKSHYTDCEV